MFGRGEERGEEKAERINQVEFFFNIILETTTTQLDSPDYIPNV